jgi:putative inorganic carbon (HCO3(-)) transporter
MVAGLRPAARIVTQWSVWILGAAALGAMLTPRLLLPAVVLGLLLAAIRWLGTGRLAWPTPADWPILLLLLLLPMAVWVAPYRDLALPQALRVLLGVLLYTSVAYAAGALGQSWALAAGVTAVGVLLALAAPFVTQLPGLARLAQMAPAAIGVNPNVLAGALLLTSAFPLAILSLRPWRENRLLTLIALASAALLVGGLALTRSRGALMGLAALALVLLICRARAGVGRRRVAAMLAVALVGAMLLAAALVGASLLGAPGSASGVSGMDLRLEIWSRARLALDDFPLTGVGIGNFPRVVNLLYPTFLIPAQSWDMHAHNLYLQVALDLGLVGLAAWLAIFMLALAGAWRMYSAPDERAQVLGAALLAGLVAVAVHGLTDAVLWGVGPAVLLWAVWGLALGDAARFTQPPVGAQPRAGADAARSPGQ